MYHEYEKIEDIKFSDELLRDTEFVDCEFVNCTFENVSLENCNFMGCKFVKCNIISIQSKYSQIKNTDFTECNLIGIRWYELLPQGRIAAPIRKLSGCFMKYNTFLNMSLMKFNFNDNIVQESTFDECNLKDSSFRGCRLEATQYTNCDVRNADFREANGYQIDIKTNRLKGARFSFPEVVSLLNALEIKVD